MVCSQIPEKFGKVVSWKITVNGNERPRCSLAKHWKKPLHDSDGILSLRASEIRKGDGVWLSGQIHRPERGLEPWQGVVNGGPLWRGVAVVEALSDHPRGDLHSDPSPFRPLGSDD